MTQSTLPVQIRSIHCEATGVFSFVLGARDRTGLPPFQPGSHVDVHLPNGLTRSYSLSNSAENGLYRLTVARDPNSSGGSAFLHEQIRPGQALEISAPRNNFPLFEEAPLSVFVAGGIGVTPFVPMMARLNECGRRWRIHYCIRTRDRAALLEEIEALGNAGLGEIVLNVDQEPGGAMLDISAVIDGLAPQDHVYCCGPIGMLDAFRRICRERTLPSKRVHFEYFSSSVATASDGGFNVVLARSAKTVRVPRGQTILQALLAADFDLPHSCEQGVCGACETTVLAGQPDHRDMLLSDQEKAAGRSMMICCSGAKSDSLTLDI